MASKLSLDRNSAWGNKSQEDEEEPIASFAEIMSEELAEQLDETKLFDSTPLSTFDHSLAAYGLDESLSGASDLEIARALQEKFDQEQAAVLKAEEERKSASKIEVGFHFSEKPHMLFDDDGLPIKTSEDFDKEDNSESDSTDDEEGIATEAFHRYDCMAKSEFPSCGFVKDSLGRVITKHNKEIAEAHNVDKALELPLNIPTGDLVGEKLSNRVYNNLRSCAKTDAKRSTRLQDKEEVATSEQSIDAVTRMIIYRWINSDGLFDVVEGVIATGKESVVLHGATRDLASNTNECHFAIKAYKLTLSKFKNRFEYVVDDYRFKNPRRVLRVWAKREFINLQRIFRAGIRCPEPISLKKHLMLMSFIGSNGIAATKLKDVIWSDDEAKSKAFEEVKQIMICMYKKCNLIHADLSEFNLLYHNEHVYVIDVSQAMDLSHSRSLLFLLCDIENVLEFFEKIGVENLPSATELFNEITDLNMDLTKNLFLQVEHFEKNNRNVQLREDKAKPGDMELRLYNAEVALAREDPAALFN